MRVLVFGLNGMLGHQVARRFRLDHDVYGTIRGSAVPAALPEVTRGATVITEVTPSDPLSIVRALHTAAPELVVNCLGIVKQRQEVTDASSIISANSLFPHALLEMCTLYGTRLIHVSTDCVFSGGRGSYTEDDEPDPVDLYGRTKLLGEVRTEGALTIRTSIVGWQLTGTSGLLEWVAANKGEAIQGYTNARFSGLSTAALAETLVRIAGRPGLSGLFNVSADPISKFELIHRLADRAGWDTQVVPAPTPVCDRTLDSSRFRGVVDWRPPIWDEMILGLLNERPDYERWRNESATRHG